MEWVRWYSQRGGGHSSSKWIPTAKTTVWSGSGEYQIFEWSAPFKPKNWGGKLQTKNS